MAPRGLSQKSNKKDKKKVGFTEEQKSKVYSTKVPEKFCNESSKKRINQFLKDIMEDRIYDVERARSVDLSAQIAGIVREESPSHYKHVVVCMIGSRVDQPSIYLGSRCLWNEVTDSFTSIRYSNNTLYCVVLVYALFYQK